MRLWIATRTSGSAITEQLDPRKRRAVELRFGIGENTGPRMLLAEVGGAMGGFSKEWAPQEIRKALTELRAALWPGEELPP